MTTSSTPAQGPEKSDAALKKFERLTEIPMALLSLTFLVVLVLPVLDTHFTQNLRQAFADVDIVIWAIFAAEYLTRLVLAPYKLQFIWKNMLDLLIVGVPVLRPLRLARMTRLGQVGGLVTRESRGRLHIDTAIEVVLVTVIVVFVGTVGMLDVERNAPGSNIHTFSDALWWTLSTVSSVGYGDKFPVTAQGRLIGTVVMFTGIAVLGVVTAAVAGWFVDNLQAERDEAKGLEETERLNARLTEVLERLARIETHLGTAAAKDGQSGTEIP